MASRRRRLTLVEYGAPADLVAQVAGSVSIDRTKARQVLQLAGERAARTLGFSQSPLVIEPVGVRAVDMAGMIRLAPSLELEIAPKFLGLDSDDGRWREDFFFLANLSRHGRLLAAERLRSSGGAPRDLAALVARSFVDMYWDNPPRAMWLRSALLRKVLYDAYQTGDRLGIRDLGKQFLCRS